MENLSNCWVCGRTTAEVRATQYDEGQADSEFANQFAQVAQFKAKLMKSAADWRRAIPKDFKLMEFDFVVENAEQFSAFSAIDDVKGAKKEIMGWLGNASIALRNQNEPELQALKLSTLRSEDRAKLLNSLEGFESTWHRLLVAGEGKQQKAQYPVGFKGLNLVDGVEYLIAGGSFYYDVLGMLVQFAREEKARKAPRLEVGAIPIRGLGRVPICDICREMIIELREAAANVAEVTAPQAPKMPEQPASEPEPQPMAPVAPRQPPRRIRAQEVSEDQAVEGSPGYVEIVKKLSNAPVNQEDEAASQKPRYLHEHRLKEDWEALEQQQGSS
jgi:hypothetical protein